MEPETSSNTNSRIADLERILGEILRASGMTLEFTVRQGPGGPDEPEFTVDFTGPDVEILLEKKGAALDALEHIVVKAARLDEDSPGRVSFDAAGFRQFRTEELRTMARMAADRVIETSIAFAMNPMTARERRIVHLALRDDVRVTTESEGRGPERHLVIRPATPSRT